MHEGGWNLRFDTADELVAIRPNGNVLPRPRPMEHHDGHEIERDNRVRGVSINPTTCIPRWYGDPLDLEDIVSGLMATEPSG